MFTVFLVVMVIVLLKSVIDCSPILFVKIGQQAVGAIDFQLTSSSYSDQKSETPTPPMIPANTNWYAIDPFDNPYKVREPDVVVNVLS